MIKTFFGSHTEKGLHVYYGEDRSQIQTHFNSQSHSSRNENKGAETSVTKCCGISLRIFRDFVWIFGKWKLLGMPLDPLASPLPTPLSKLVLRSSIETPSLLFMMLNNRYPTKLACSTSLKKIQKLPNNGYASNAKCPLQFKNFSCTLMWILQQFGRQAQAQY